jgi:hypothetical protein
MHLDIPGIRPRLLQTPGYQLSNEMRGFRHIFRHAYDYELDEVRLGQLKARVMTGWTAVKDDIGTFGRFLREALNSEEK